MGKNFLANAFSLQMLPDGDVDVAVRSISVESVKAMLLGDFTNAIGHADTAAVVGSILGLDLQANRVNIALNKGDALVVAQLVGGRLPEGSTTLPEGFQLVFKLVTIA